jgi:uncharacterized protein YqgV (UPF0045/DUF77 family)
MNVQAEISLYPLGEGELLSSIDEFVGILRAEGLNPSMGAMSTAVFGECKIVFDSIARAFEHTAGGRRCVLVAKYSNACPPPAED